METIAYEVDKPRIDRVLELISKGLFFHEYHEKWQKPILIFSTGLINFRNLGNNDQIRHLDWMASQLLSNEPQKGEHPEIFQNQNYWDSPSEFLVVRMVFYGGVAIIASSSDRLSALIDPRKE